jgi:hypothetical protein
VQAVYHCRAGAFQPQLSRKEARADGSAMFHVHLVETVVPPLFDVPNEIGLLATLLRLGLRFRYEVIQKCAKLLAATPRSRMKAEDVQDIAMQLREAVETIEWDAASRGAENIDRASVIELFDTEPDKCLIADISDQWDRARARLFATESPPTVDMLAEVIDEMREVNYTFLTLGTRRQHEMVSRRWQSGPARASRTATAAVADPA